MDSSRRPSGPSLLPATRSTITSWPPQRALPHPASAFQVGGREGAAETALLFGVLEAPLVTTATQLARPGDIIQGRKGGPVGRGLVVRKSEEQVLSG